MTAHKHAAAMALYAQDAAETEAPWLRWECKGTGPCWLDLGEHPAWHFTWDYRRKPRTIRIGERDVPEPMRVAPQEGTMYWMPAFSGHLHASTTYWDGCEFDEDMLKHGFTHTTKEAAIAHAEALILISGGTL